MCSSDLKQLKQAEEAGNNEATAAAATLIEQRGVIEQAKAQAYGTARARVMAWNITGEGIAALAGPVSDWNELNPREREDATAAHHATQDELIAGHEGREEAIRKVAEAFMAFAEVKGHLDDPNDFKALLRGAGVLEFRIAPASADVLDLKGYRDRLAKRGPHGGTGLPYRWMEIDDIKQFADEESERRRLMEDAIAFFNERDQIGQAYHGRYYMLLGNG